MSSNSRAGKKRNSSLKNRFEECGALLERLFRNGGSTDSEVLLKTDDIDEATALVKEMQSQLSSQAVRKLAMLSPRFMGDISWEEFLGLLSGDGHPFPATSSGLLLSMWDDRKKEHISRFDGALLWNRVPARNSIFLYRLSEAMARRRGGETWGRVPLLLLSRAGSRGYIPFDILLAMAFSRKDGKNMLHQGTHAHFLWKTVLDRFAPDIFGRMTSWIESGGGKPAPFDIRALLSVTSRVLGRGAETVFPFSQEMVDHAAMYRICPENLFERTDSPRENDFFGSAVSTGLSIPARNTDLWFVTSERGDITSVRTLGTLHGREFRRKLLSTSIPWSLPMNDNNLTRLFLDVACPPGSGTPADPSHPSKAEYFIFMPGDAPLLALIKPGEHQKVYERFLSLNMIPYQDGKGFGYMNTMDGERLISDRMLSSLASREDSGGACLWNTVGGAVFLGLFLDGYIHPDMDVPPPAFSPAEVLLRESMKQGGENMDRVIDTIIRLFSMFETGPDCSGDDAARMRAGSDGSRNSPRYLLSTPWDREIASRLVFSIGRLSSMYPSIAWCTALDRHLGETASGQSWFKASPGTGMEVEFIPGMRETLTTIRSRGIIHASEGSPGLF